MIRLKKLLSEQADKTQSKTIPNVLFIGDSSLSKSWSYAQRLIDNKSVNGNIVYEKSPTTDDLLRLIRTNINDEYNIVSISLFNLNSNEIKKNNISTITTNLTDILETAKSYGSKVVLVPPINNEIPKNLSSWISKQNIADSILDLPVDDNLRRSNIRLTSVWANNVNELFDDTTNIEIPVPKIDITPNKKTTLKDKLKSAPDQKNKIKKSDDNDLQSAEDLKTVNNKTSSITPAPHSEVNANFSDTVENQAYNIILPFEGFNATPQIDFFIDKNGVSHGDGYCRIGHGSSHITKEDGTVITMGKPKPGKTCAETYPYTITIDDAQRDLKRLISKTFKPYVTNKIKQLGGDVSKFNDATIAVLISVVYNYGHMPNELEPGIAASDMNMIANALINDFTSSKSNPKRRKKEGDYILSSLTSQPEDDNKSLFGKAWQSVKNTLGLSNPSKITAKPHIGSLSYTSGFGPRWGKFHYGIDYSLGVGTPIYMVTPGVITRADGRNATGYGNVIYVKHDDGIITRYGHMSQMDVSVGDRVEYGDLIGLTGGAKGAPGAGNSTGPHLHWEYHENGSAKDGVNVAQNYFSTHPIAPEQPLTPSEVEKLNI